MIQLEGHPCSTWSQVVVCQNLVRDRPAWIFSNLTRLQAEWSRLTVGIDTGSFSPMGSSYFAANRIMSSLFNGTDLAHRGAQTRRIGTESDKTSLPEEACGNWSSLVLFSLLLSGLEAVKRS
jgi:hypothetical protein